MDVTANLESFKQNLKELDKRVSDGEQRSFCLYNSKFLQYIILLHADSIEPTSDLKIAQTWVEFVLVS